VNYCYENIRPTKCWIESLDRDIVCVIVVINVKKKIKKNDKKRVFYPKNKKRFVNVIKTLTYFYLLLKKEPIN